MTPDLVLLGNLLVDDIVYADGSSRMGQAGGAMLYSSLAAVLWDMPTGCVSVQGDDYPESMRAALRDNSRIIISPFVVRTTTRSPRRTSASGETIMMVPVR